MNLSITEILLTIFLVLLYRIFQKNKNLEEVIILNNVDNFTEKNIVNILDISDLSKLDNNLKLKLTKNNNSFDIINNKLVYKIINPQKNYLSINQNKYLLKNIIIDTPNLKYKNKLVDLEIKLDFNGIFIIIPIIASNNINNYLELFRIDHFDTYQSGIYLINNLPIPVQNVNNKGKLINIWFYPLVKFIESNKKLLYKNNNYYTENYYLNKEMINRIKKSLS
jgi:hypothetical protein